MSYWIGPVQLVDLFEPQLTFTGSPTALGLQPGQITGQTEWWQAHQLKELVNNPQRRVTIGGQSGVLEPIYFSDPMLGPLTSWCLLQSFQLGQADQTHSLQGTTGLVPYTLTLAQIGDSTQRQVVIVRSARAKSVFVGVTPYSVVAKALYDEDFDGSAFSNDPGGTRFTREYDPTFPHSTPQLIADGRQETLYTAAFVGGVDQLSLVVLSRLSEAAVGPPSWVTNRGHDCRSYDRRTMREVYGPSHRWAVSTDVMMTNGLLRGWVGNVGITPFLTVQAFRNSRWTDAGYLVLTDPEGEVALRGARLVRVTPDQVTVALAVQDQSDVFVTLRRGERMFRVAHGSGNTAAARVVRWTGLPPWTRLRSASQGVGKFGSALAGSGDFRLRWPAL